ncbi:hypothetical protein [uncultured Ruegeria sp.]|uniref:hypothetical protein n=1 Tax=uncultured Ruegeria sp. TaxID=259304 RepID=UPI0026216EF0|nr:hypothetical protein [uncultured Ruegeria sp.]
MKLKLTALIIVIAAPLQAQQLLHQPTDASPPTTIPAPLLNEIDDPFFKIAIQSEPQPRSLTAVINTLLEGGRSDFQSFVVGEQIGRSALSTECGPSNRRMVISFNGTHAPSGIVLDNNVFFSVFMTPDNPVGDIEVVAWDATHGTYNYYKLEGGTWRFRNSSSELDTASSSHLSQGCLSCHVSGGPVMKEFTFPWNHWHSLPNTFEALYLFPGVQSWPIANTNFLGNRLNGAQILEVSIQSSLQRFADADIRDHIDTASDGSVLVSDLPNLIDSLFQPTELNLGSSNKTSGLDEGGLTDRATGALNIPDSFFVNIFQMRDIDLPVFGGLGLVTNVFTPGNLGLSLEEYEELLSDNSIGTECMPGRDTLFPWFGPEPSEFDRRMVERLNRRGVVDDAFIAAVLAIDVETPLFSQERASLLRHVPQEVRSPSLSQLPDTLRAVVIASLEAEANRSAAEDDFLTLLKNPDPVTELDTRVRGFLARTQEQLADPAARQTHLQQLFSRLLENREVFQTNPISAPLNEFTGLIPKPAN